MALAAALVRAQSGYRSDVAALVAHLKQTDVYAPLYAGGDLSGEPTTIGAGKSLRLHNVRGGDGTVWIALFSGVATLRDAGVRHGWTTDGGPLRFVAFRWDDAIAGMFREALETGGNAGIVFDEGSASELALNGVEVLSIARGEPLPLVHYVGEQPTRGNEQVFIGEPATPPPAELIEAVRSVLAGEKEVTSYRIRQVYMPERDVMPHLVLDIETSSAESERARIAQRVGEKIREIQLPPPGYLDIAFNFALGNR